APGMGDATPAAASRSRSAITAHAPSAARARAIADPIAPAPPVISATRPSSSRAVAAPGSVGSRSVIASTVNLVVETDQALVDRFLRVFLDRPCDRGREHAGRFEVH